MNQNQTSQKESRTPGRVRLWIVIVSVILALAVGIFAGTRISGLSSLMPPVEASLPQDSSQYTEEEQAVLDRSQSFWTAMEAAGPSVPRSSYLTGSPSNFSAIRRSC